MNIFKKLFSKKKKKEKEEKKPECWYNNAHEDPSSKLGVPMEGAAFSDPDQIDFAAVNNITQSHF